MTNTLNKEVRVSDVEPRLARIESKLDNLSDAFVTMARIDERMVTLFNRMDGYDSRQSQILDRMVTLERSAMTIRAVEKLAYIVASAGVASLFWWLQRGV